MGHSAASGCRCSNSTIGEIRDDATVADLGALAFDSDDVKALKNCREGSCDVQLPTSGIQRFREGVD